ncbi:MAG: VirD4-like conjugal transfer protein, CD1115 family [Candidatus Scatovivens sp.]
MYGGSGAGKSASYVIPNALQLLGSYVFTDPKGELYDKTAGFFKEKGYNVKVFNLVNPENSDGYNPLNHITSEIDVDVIANTIVRGQNSGEGKQDPFWDDMSEFVLKALIYFLKADRPPEEQNLASCSELLRAASTTGSEGVLANLIHQLPFDHPARMYFKNVEDLPEKTLGSVYGTLQSKLGKFDSKEIAEVTSTDTIDFEEIGSQKTAVYVISSDTHTAYDFLLTIFFSQMIQQLYDYADKAGGELPVPTYFILDEFANIGRIPDFDKKISTSRSRKISFSVILQNLDQLEAVYEKSHETIIGNCDTHLFLGSNSQKTVEYFSKALGEKTITRDSISVNKDREDWKQGKSESDQIMARALMTPDELRRMDVDECIIYEKGLKPIKANKYYYFKYPEGKLVNKYKVDHNDVHIERGPWRKYNPNNPYVDESNGGGKSPMVESLDDLFDEDAAGANSNSSSKGNDNNTSKEELTDIQKELEAKFDELFGSMDD